MSIYKKIQNYYSADDAGTGDTTTTGDDNKTTEGQNTVADGNQNLEESKNFKAFKEAQAKKEAQLTAKLQKYEVAEKLKTEEELKAKGKFEELLASKDSELNKYKEEAKLQTYTNKLTTELIKLGINQDMMDFVIPTLATQLKSNDSGEIENMTQLLTTLKQSRPSLFSAIPPVQAGTTGGQNSGAGSKASMDYATAAKIASNPDATEYLKNQPEIDKALMAG
jgi:hypothetical protein